jgi:rhodanese-related sulfurtransferase
VPPANLQAIFMRMQRVDAAPGQTIVTQGEAGDYFYVITEGRCIVTREQPGQKAVRLAELDSGSCFGEEALISDTPRNASVTMLTRGSLMRLAKDDFRKLLKEPLTRRVSRAEGDALVERGRGIYLDVRLPSEYQNGSLPGALNIPLYMLRMRLSQLPAGKGLICVCDTGRRSSVASFVLTQKGYEAYRLSPGLNEAG